MVTGPLARHRMPSDPVLVHRLVRLLHASFRPSVAGAPLRFAMNSPPSGCQGDFHPRAVEHARHTNKKPASLLRRKAGLKTKTKPVRPCGGLTGRPISEADVHAELRHAPVQAVPAGAFAPGDSGNT